MTPSARSAAASVTNNSTLSINRGDALLNLGNTIHGTGSVSYDGSGSVTVSGNSDYTGASTVNAGLIFLTSGTGFGAPSSGTTIANGAQVYITANVDVPEGFTINGVGGDSNGSLRKGGAGPTTDSGPIILASDSSIGVDGGATLTLSNTVSGGFTLTAIGTGTLGLITNNTLAGFTLNGPIINVGSSGSLGGGPVTVSGAGRFVLATGMTFTNAVTANTVSPGAVTGLIMVNDDTNGTVTTVTGALTFNATAASGNDFYGPLTSGLLNITGPITNDATGFVGARDGFVRFSGGGDYLEFDLNQGTTSIGANNGLCTNAIFSQSASGPSVFDLNGFNQTLAGLSDGAANPKTLTNSSGTASTLTVNSGGATPTPARSAATCLSCSTAPVSCCWPEPTRISATPRSNPGFWRFPIRRLVQAQPSRSPVARSCSWISRPRTSSINSC